jgi:hypothetical protein
MRIGVKGDVDLMKGHEGQRMWSKHLKCGAGRDEVVKYMKGKDETRHTVVPAQVIVACPH